MRAISNNIVIRHHDLEAELAPAIGGGLAYLHWRGIDLLRPLSVSDRTKGNVLGVAMFPMVPYANRIAGNKFRFGGRWYSLEPNNPPERFNVHGTGWRRAWRAQEVSQTQATMSLDITQADLPHWFRAEQRFEVGPAGLKVEIVLTNLGNVPMPFGFGLHPWFKRDGDVSLQFEAERFNLEEPDGVSGDPVSIPPELDFARARPLPDGWRNNDYGGWKGKAEITYPDRGFGIRILADPIFRHLMIYADPTKPFFCVEPQTNAACAFNRDDRDSFENGVIVIKPADCASGSVTFQPYEI